MSEKKENPQYFDLEFLWNTYTSISESIKFSDMKAGAVITIQTIIWGFILSESIDFSSKLSSSSTFIIFLSLLMLILSLASIILALFSIHPSLKLGDSSSPIYFAEIAKLKNNGDKFDTYFEKVINLTKQEEARAIASSIWESSSIAKKKFNLVSWSIKLLFIVLVVFVELIVFK